MERYLLDTWVKPIVTRSTRRQFIANIRAVKETILIQKSTVTKFVYCIYNYFKYWLWGKIIDIRWGWALKELHQCNGDFNQLNASFRASSCCMLSFLQVIHFVLVLIYLPCAHLYTLKVRFVYFQSFAYLYVPQTKNI